MLSYRPTRRSSIQVSDIIYCIAILPNERLTEKQILKLLIKVYMRNLGIGAGNLAAGFALVLVPYLFLLVSRNIHLFNK